MIIARRYIYEEIPVSNILVSATFNNNTLINISFGNLNTIGNPIWLILTIHFLWEIYVFMEGPDLTPKGCVGSSWIKIIQLIFFVIWGKLQIEHRSGHSAPTYLGGSNKLRVYLFFIYSCQTAISEYKE